MSTDPDPLQEVHTLERSIGNRLETARAGRDIEIAARAQADGILAAARAEAATMAAAAADELHQRAVVQARLVLERATADVEQLALTAQARREDDVQSVLAAVLPAERVG